MQFKLKHVSFYKNRRKGPVKHLVAVKYLLVGFYAYGPDAWRDFAAESDEKG